MAQLFKKDDETEIKFFETWQDIIQQTFNDIEQYYINAYKSKELGEALYKAEAVALYKILEKDLFLKAYYQIMESLKRNGTIDAHLKILYAIFGDDATITVKQTPLAIHIDIEARSVQRLLWITKNGDNIITKNGDNLVFVVFLANITNRQLINLLKATTNAGVYIEFSLTIIN